MKLKHLFTAGVLFAASATWSVADDSMKSTTAKPVIRKEVAEEIRGDRELEIRLGPRINEIGGSFQDAYVRSALLSASNGTIGGFAISGDPKSTVDIRRDLGHDDPGPGVQLDVDWKPFKTFNGPDWTQRIHLGLDYKFDNSDATKTLPSGISFAGAYFPAGSSLRTDMDLHQIDYTIGYDVIRTHTFKVTPFVGGKTVIADFTVNGTEIRQTSPTTAVAQIYNRTDSSSFTMFDVGADLRINISRSWYVGITPQGFGLDQWYTVQGSAYTGYDFSRSWGVRVGIDTLYANWKSSGAPSNHADGVVGAGFIQGVWGF